MHITGKTGEGITNLCSLTYRAQDGTVYYNAFDEYHVKRNLSVMQNLPAGYINARLDMYLGMLQE